MNIGLCPYWFYCRFCGGKKAKLLEVGYGVDYE